MTINDVKFIELPRFKDPRGNLSFVQELDQIPFEILRTYWIYDVPGGESRGGHAHKRLQQFIVALSGSFTVNLCDGKGNVESYHLNHPYQGLLIKNMVWRTIDDFSSGAVCLVLASDPFDEDDYIRNYEEYQLSQSESH